MEDDHVDRPGVEVRQRMKLTGTNSSIGLIILITNAHLNVLTDERGLRPLSSGQGAPSGAAAGRPCGLRPNVVLHRRGDGLETQPKGCDLRGKDERDGKQIGVRACCPVRHSLFATSSPASRSKIVRFVDLVVMAGWLHPFPFRTRP